MKNYRITAIAFALFLGCSSVSYADQFENQGGAAQGLEGLAEGMGGQLAPPPQDLSTCYWNLVAWVCAYTPKGAIGAIGGYQGGVPGSGWGH